MLKSNRCSQKPRCTKTRTRTVDPLVEAKNDLEGLAYSSTASMTEFGERLADEDRASIEALPKEAETVRDSNNILEVRRVYDDLGDAVSVLGNLLYEEAAQAAMDSDPEDA